MSAQFYFDSGVKKSLESDFAGAIEDYTVAIKLSSGVTPETITNKKVRDSVIETESLNVYNISEGYTEIYFNRGCAYLAIGKFYEAKLDFDKVIEYSPKDAEAYFKRATINYCLRYDDLAKSDLDMAKRLDSKYTEEMFLAQWPK